jgi:hypothetical protein
MHVFALTTDQEYLTDKKLATFPFDVAAPFALKER